jgi:hypothetical protein
MSGSKSKTHIWINPGNILYKPYCRRCGLVKLNNPITNWCVSQGCYYDEHPKYKQTLKRMTSQKWLKKKGFLK